MKTPLLRALVVGAAVLATHPPGVMRAQADGLIVHELATTAGRSVGQNTATMKPIVTASGSIMLAELSPEWRQRPHHHEQEQVLLVLSGALDVSVGDRTQNLGPMQVAIPPSNVPHNMNNNSGKSVRVLEYQPVARQDWLGTPAAPQKQIPQPLALAAGQIVNADLSHGAAEWRVGADGGRSKSFAGQSIRIDVWELPTPNSSARLEARTAGARRFLYMIEGESRLISTGAPRTIAHDTVVEMSDQTSMRVQPAGTGRTVFAVFEMLAK